MAQSTARVDELVRSGLEHHRSGRLDAAERAYRAALTENPEHHVALHFLGLLAAQAGHVELATDLLARATAASPREPMYLINLGLVLKQQGRLADAARTLRRATQIDPRGVEAHIAYGQVLLEQGRPEDARVAFENALEIAPEIAAVHNNLGIALQALGQLENAMDAFRRALALDHTDVDAHINLGLALRVKGLLEESVANLRGALAIDPRHAIAANNLGLTLQALGRLDDARECFESATTASPDCADFHVNLAIVLNHLGSFTRAHVSLDRALQLQPRSVVALTSLGNLLRLEGKLDDAVACYQKALELAPRDADVLTGLGLALLSGRRVQEALLYLERVAAVQPDSATAQNNIGMAFRVLGDLERAAERFRAAIALRPDYVPAHSNRLACLNYLPGVTPEDILGEHRRFAQRFEGPLMSKRSPHPNLPDPHRRLRVGYVSGDFVEHAMTFSVESVLAHHDRSRFKVICYANNGHEDEVTARLMRHADVWNRVVGLSDDAMAAMVREDRIDILVDLSGHTALNRLMVFARKPAPVQVAWLGYVTTTGLSAMDYRLTDACVDPPGVTDGHYVETLVRLPCVTVFQPADDSPPVNPLPALGARVFTFACLNHLAKVTPEVIAVWARILEAVPTSRLVFGNANDTLVRERLASAFAKHGVTASRLDFRARLPVMKFLELHHEIDLALDPFPYNGGATSCHSLWMGVPFVTLIGDRYMARMGASLLKAVAMEELVAHTTDEYVALAVRLASDRSQLAALRTSLRERLEASPLMNAPEFVRNVEKAYRQMWQTWCDHARAMPETFMT